MPHLLCLLLSLWIASSASAVTMEWTPIGNPGNVCDTQVGPPLGCYGAVGYAYSIGTYEVTYAQYAEFLNAKAASDPYGLYNSSMAFVQSKGGITRSGGSGGYSYSVIPGRGEMPVSYVSFYDALRFANWMNNGQGAADTETGSYNLLGGTATPSNGTSVVRSVSASVVLPSENEWYKAAYYEPHNVYYDYPARTNTATICSAPTAAPNRANCGPTVGDLTIKGSYPGSPSFYGTFDQGGNAAEWVDTIINDTRRGVRGGAYFAGGTNLNANERRDSNPAAEGAGFGFRLAMIPEPSTGLLVMAGLLGIAGRRRALA